MAQVNPYLLFNGTCEAAFNLYKSVFGGEFPYIGKFKDAPPQPGQTMSPADAERIMHVSLPISKETILMGSDSNSQHGDVKVGTNFSISVNASSEEEANKIFNGLSAGGTIMMAMEKTFWGAYFGMFIDKFGISWMVNYDYNQQPK
jgi:PhnB protein